MKKHLFSFAGAVLFGVALIFMGCNARSRHGVYNEIVTLPLADSHSARINFSHKGTVLNVNMYLNKEGKSLCRSHYVGETKFSKRDAHYTITLGQYRVVTEDMTKKEQKLYTEPGFIQMEVNYLPKQKAYNIRISQSHCPALNMDAPALVYSAPKNPDSSQPDKERSWFGKMIDAIGDGILFCREKVNSVFDYVFGNISFESHWWFLFYLGGLMLMALGLKVFSPLVWIGVIMQYAYLQFMSPPFFMLWPSIVGWGWTIICVIPIILIVAFNFAMCVAVIVSAFTHWLSFLILIVPAFIAILSIFTLLDIAFTDHLELLVFFLLGAGAESYTLVGTFTDVNGNVFKVYKK